MSTSTVATIVNGAITSLGDYFTAILPIVIPVGIAVAVLFGGIYFIRSLSHKR